MTTEPYKTRCILHISYEQIERALGLKIGSIRYIGSAPLDQEAILVNTDDERIGYKLHSESVIPRRSIPIEFNDDDSIKEGKTLP